MYSVEVVGESHYQENLEAICGERTPEGENRVIEAVLVLDDTNPLDDQAVRVEIESKTVGYLSRDNARTFRDWRSKQGQAGIAFPCMASIAGGWDRGGGDVGHYGVRLDLSLSDPGAGAIAPKEKKGIRWGKVLLYLIVGIFFSFVACFFLGVVLQLLGQ